MIVDEVYPDNEYKFKGKSYKFIKRHGRTLNAHYYEKGETSQNTKAAHFMSPRYVIGNTKSWRRSKDPSSQGLGEEGDG